MKIYKKLIAFGVTAVTALCSTFGSYAEEEQDVSTEARYVVYSEDFPDAYIIVEESTPISLLADNENEVCMGAGLFYGCGGKKGIPEEWIAKIAKKDWIKELCDKAEAQFCLS